jgi:hypothetical protein
LPLSASRGYLTGCYGHFIHHDVPVDVHRCSDVCVTHGSPEVRLFRLEDHYALNAAHM